MANQILCAISTINSASIRFTQYQYKEVEYPGAQTNQAPVKMLLDQAQQAGHPVNRILCLCSKEAKEPRSFSVDGQDCSESAFDFFCRDVRSYCGEHGIFLPQNAFVEIPYDIDSPADTVSRVTAGMKAGDTLHIEMTGGGRDVMVLLTLAMQVMQFKNVQLGHVVYSVFTKGNDANKKNRIVVQDDTFALTGLLNGVSEFTRYGKAAGLCRYFENSSCQPIKELCGEMKAFSDDLILCRTTKVDERVKKIHAKMDELTQLPPEALSAPGEQLFCALIPTIKAGFVRVQKGPDKEESAVKTALLRMNLIRWCAENELLQQALSFYREYAAQSIVDLRLVVPTDELLHELDSLKEKENKDRNRYMNSSSNSNNRIILLYQDPKEVALELLAKNQHLLLSKQSDGTFALKKKKKTGDTICAGAKEVALREYTVHIPQKELETILFQYEFLHQLRNCVMHAGDNNGWKDYTERAQNYNLPGSVADTSPEQVKRILLDAAGQLIHGYKT